MGQCWVKFNNSKLLSNLAVTKDPEGGGAVKYDVVHMRDQAFSKQPLNEFGSLQKNDP